MKFLMIALVIMGLLMAAASAFVLYSLAGGASFWDVRRRGYESTEQVLIGQTVQLKVPQGFRPDGYQYLADMPPGGDAFPHAINDTSVEFHASLGAYLRASRAEWSARITAEVAAPGVGSLPALAQNWRRSNWTGCVAEKQGQRVRVEAAPGIYSATQCQQIADGSLASLHADTQKIAAFYELRAARLSAQPANRKSAWDLLESRGFRPLPAEDNLAVRQSDGHLLYLFADRNHAMVWYKIAVIPIDASTPFESLREDFAQTKRYLKQHHAVSGLMLTYGQGRYRLATSAAPVLSNEQDALTALLAQETPRGAAVLWRTFQMLDFANRGAAPLKEWFEDSDRIRAAQSPVWRVN
jgi:hypothetical protein